MQSVFRPHGHFHTYIEGRILISEVTGPWNRELVLEWANDIYPLAVELASSGPHVGIAVVRRSMLCPQDALDELARVVRYSCKYLQCLGHLIVAEQDIDGRGLLESQYAKIYEGVTAHRFFDTLDEARAFAAVLLRDKGF